MITTAILTNCTNRKRSLAGDPVQFRQIEVADIADVAAQWAKLLAQVSEKASARSLYCGRSFSEALATAEHARANLSVVSAGLGVVSAETLIPNYSATISVGSEDSILAKVPGIGASDWWKYLTQTSEFNSEVKPEQFDRIWIALSSPYLEMMRYTLESWISSGIQGLRIFSKSQATSTILAPYILPYDDRLNDPIGPIPGTQADFSQRALAHFSTISSPIRVATLEQDCEMVRTALSSLRAPEKFSRQTRTDTEIRTIIGTEAQLIGWSSTKMLRHLRDELGVACEQKRFQKLFKAEMSEVTPQ